MISRRLAFPGVLLIACIASWLISDGLSASAPTRATALAGDGLERPLISEDRVSAANTRLNVVDALAPIVETIRAPSSPRACSVVLVDGEVLSSTRSDLPLVPGPVQMLVTGWAAVSLLGPDHRFATTVLSESLPGDDGVVAGSLYLIGGGDPVLVTPTWAAINQPGHTVATDPSELATAVVDAGVSTVLGAVIGVERRFDQLRGLPGLAAESGESADALGALGALRINAAVLPDDNRTPVDRANPAAASAAIFDDLLEARGVGIAGLSRAFVSDEELPELVEIASIESAPLSAIVNQMLVENDAAIAELLLKEIGYVLAGEGSTRSGARLAFDASRDVLGVDLGAPPLSGSGWDAIGTATCGQLATFVQAMDFAAFVTPPVESYHSAALGERPGAALAVRGEFGGIISVGLRAGLATDGDQQNMPEVSIVSIINASDEPTEADRQHVRDLLSAIDLLRDAYAQTAGTN